MKGCHKELRELVVATKTLSNTLIYAAHIELDELRFEQGIDILYIRSLIYRAVNDIISILAKAEDV